MQGEVGAQLFSVRVRWERVVWLQPVQELQACPQEATALLCSVSQPLPGRKRNPGIRPCTPGEGQTTAVALCWDVPQSRAKLLPQLGWLLALPVGVLHALQGDSRRIRGQGQVHVAGHGVSRAQSGGVQPSGRVLGSFPSHPNHHGRCHRSLMAGKLQGTRLLVF